MMYSARTSPHRPLVSGAATVLALALLSALLVVITTSTAGAEVAPPPPATAKRSVKAKHWPGKHNTGPGRVRLRPYHGPCTITSPRRIVRVDATRRCDALLIRSPRVVIKRSVVPRIDATDGGDASVKLVRTRVKGGEWVDGAVWGYNITGVRLNVTGGQHSVHCAGNCTITDSWLHDQWNPAGRSFHNNAFISNGGSDMVIRHNTLACTPLLNRTDGGCTADLSLFGDFDPISKVTVDNNLFMANNSSISYCFYGGHDRNKPYGDNPTYIRVTNNVFQRGANRKCGVYGAVTSFKKSSRTNVWANNRWSKGGRVHP